MMTCKRDQKRDTIGCAAPKEGHHWMCRTKRGTPLDVPHQKRDTIGCAAPKDAAQLSEKSYGKRNHKRNGTRDDK